MFFYATIPLSPAKKNAGAAEQFFMAAERRLRMGGRGGRPRLPCYPVLRAGRSLSRKAGPSLPQQM